MNKKEFIDQVSDKSGLTKFVAATAVDAVIASIQERLKLGETITLLGLGTFETRNRPARVGRNPKTGEAINIKASRVPAFKAGKGLKDSVNNDN